MENYFISDVFAYYIDSEAFFVIIKVQFYLNSHDKAFFGKQIV